MVQALCYHFWDSNYLPVADVKVIVAFMGKCLQLLLLSFEIRERNGRKKVAPKCVRGSGAIHCLKNAKEIRANDRLGLLIYN